MQTVFTEDQTNSIDSSKVICNEFATPNIYVKLDRETRDFRIVNNTEPFEYILINGKTICIDHLNDVIISLELYMNRNLFKTTLLLTSEESMLPHYENMGYELEGYLDSIQCYLMKSNAVFN